MKTLILIVSASILASIINSSSAYVWKCPPAGGEYPEGNKLQLDFEVLSTSSFSVSWDTPKGGVDIVNLEYVCANKKDSDNLNTEESEVMLSFSEHRHGSQDIIINTISNNSTAPMHCLVFGCYFTSDWFDLYLVKSLEFTLEPAPLVLPSPSPSPSIIPSPDPALQSNCECENIEKRKKRETTEGTTSEQGGHNPSVFLYVLAATLGILVCVLIATNVLLLLRFRRQSSQIQIS